MKTVTFFSEKGGMGKTTLSVMFASFLAYRMREAVYVADCDFPNYQFYNMRRREMEEYMRTKDLPPKSRNDIFCKEILKNFDGPYKVVPWKGMLNPSKDRMASYIEALKTVKANNEGYYILDFPGRFLDGDIAYGLMTAGLIDTVVCLVDSDPQSIQSATYINGVLKNVDKAGGQRVIILWNKELASERRNEQANMKLRERSLSDEEYERLKKEDWYSEHNRLFRALGIPIVSKRIHNIDIARRDPKPSVPGFIRSTMCWPEMNIRRSCPYMIDIFEEIKAFIDTTTDVSRLEFGTEMNNSRV